MAWASSAMAAAQTRLDIAAENLSNLSSAGYREMIDVLGAQRAFEGAGKVVGAIDQARQHAAEAARVR